VQWYDPITVDNAKRFQEMNPAFYKHAVQHLQSENWADAADAIKGALLATLPKSILPSCMRAPALVQKNIVAAAPILATLQGALKRGEIPPKRNVAETLPNGPEQIFHKRSIWDVVEYMNNYAQKAYAEDPRQFRLFALNNPTRVQTIMFDKAQWTTETAQRWLRQHHYHGLRADAKGKVIRFRQIEPEFFQKQTFRTIPFGDDGIQAVIGSPR
jgi:hypothetical protein